MNKKRKFYELFIAIKLKIKTLKIEKQKKNTMENIKKRT